MHALATLNLVNKETANLFTRALSNGDNFMMRIQNKATALIAESLAHNVYALLAVHSLYQELDELKAYFDDEKDRYDGLGEQRKLINTQKIRFVERYSYELSCSNAFLLSLISLIELFDALITSLKLVHLLGAFDARATFYELKEKYQKKINLFLAAIIQSPSLKNKSMSLKDYIKSELTNPAQARLLAEAIHASYAPGFSPQELTQLGYQIKTKIKNEIKETV